MKDTKDIYFNFALLSGTLNLVSEIVVTAYAFWFHYVVFIFNDVITKPSHLSVGGDTARTADQRYTSWASVCWCCAIAFASPLFVGFV